MTKAKRIVRDKRQKKVIAWVKRNTIYEHWKKMPNSRRESFLMEVAQRMKGLGYYSQTTFLRDIARTWGSRFRRQNLVWWNSRWT